MTFGSGERVHFVGIGGAGMSAIAKVLLERGVDVSGSDLKPSPAASMLEAMGARVHVGHDAELVSGVNVVVVSTAIPASNPEVQEAARRGLRVMTRGEALAAILNEARAVCVAGTHGKTTTTSMIVTIARAAGIDATYLVGGGLNESGTNAKHGASDLAIAESDESDGSFLLLRPDVAVVTNVEMDHVDHWTSLDALYEAFESFLGNVRPGGTAVLPGDDARLLARARDASIPIAAFGPGASIRAEDIVPTGDGSRFTLVLEEDSTSAELGVPGEHNVWNAVAAAAAARSVGIGIEDIARGIARFRGVERRFQVKGTVRGVTVIDDYAHHPTEVRATLAAARSTRPGRVVAVFQPHRYSRTLAFADPFGAAFADADRVLVMDVYGAGEDPVPGVSGKNVADAVCEAYPGRPVAYLAHRDDLMRYLESSLRSGDTVLTLGAGDITSVGDELLLRLGGSG